MSKSTMTQDEAQQWLTALGDDGRKALQETVDRAVRHARNSSYCDTFNRVMAAVLPAFVVDGRAYDTDGNSCGGRPLGALSFDPDGYDENTGYDVDGIGRNGADRQGYLSDGFGNSYDRDGFNRDGWGREEYLYWGPNPDPGNGDDSLYTGEELDEDQNHYLGRGRYVHRNRQGEIRKGHAPEVNVEPFNPTTWQPTAVTAGVTSE